MSSFNFAVALYYTKVPI